MQTRDIAGMMLSEPFTDDFILTEPGWKSPTLSAHVVLSPHVMLGNVLRAVSEENAAKNRPGMQ